MPQKRKLVDASTSPVRFPEEDIEQKSNKVDTGTQTMPIAEPIPTLLVEEALPRRRGTKRSFDVEFKIKVIEYTDDHGMAAASAHFNVKQQVVRSWLRKKGELTTLLHRNQGERKRLESPREKDLYATRDVYLQREVEEELSQVLVGWLKDLAYQGLVVTRRMLEDRAKSLWEEFASDTLPMKTDWVQDFINRQANNFSTPNMLWTQDFDAAEGINTEATNAESDKNSKQVVLKPVEAELKQPTTSGKTGGKPAAKVKRAGKPPASKNSKKQEVEKIDLKAKLQAQMKKLCG